MIHVLIVDDHAIFREGLKRVISAVPDMEVSGEASDGTTALAMILGNPYDVVVLDLGLPGMSGLDVLRNARQKRPSLPIVIMSIHTEEEYAVTVLKEGASGYLTKESVPDDLIRAVRKATTGGHYVSESLGEAVLERFLGRDVRKPHETLSTKEYQVFCLIIQGKSVKEIAYNLKLARPTVSSYRSRILRKMNMKANVDLALYAAKHGLDT